MVRIPVYMDNHATTRVDPRVVDSMLPFFDTIYGNAGSTSHVFGWEAKDAVDAARQEIAGSINASTREIIFTSGATESNNLAIRGLADRPQRRGNHVVSVCSEHRAVLDPLRRLSRHGFEITLLPIRSHGHEDAGVIDVDRLVDSIRDDTLLVSVMLANNEIGVIQPLSEIGDACKENGVLFHSDATQAVGKIPVDVNELRVDLMSFTSHKIYGPKGIGALYVRRREPKVRLASLIDGGGQEGGLRSGTLNVPGIVGFASAIRLCKQEMSAERKRLGSLRDELYRGLYSRMENIQLIGPALEPDHLRLPGNLNIGFENVDGESLMMSMNDLAVSSGSACTSADPEPSHVLRGLGLNDDQTRSSLRFGLGRFNDEEEVAFAIQKVSETVERLRKMSTVT